MSALTRFGRRAWSYTTCILDVLPDGRSIGNNSYYTNTTRRHQTAVGAHLADVVVDGVPQGTQDLAKWWEADCRRFMQEVFAAADRAKDEDKDRRAA